VDARLAPFISLPPTLEEAMKVAAIRNAFQPPTTLPAGGAPAPADPMPTIPPELALDLIRTLWPRTFGAEFSEGMASPEDRKKRIETHCSRILAMQAVLAGIEERPSAQAVLQALVEAYRAVPSRGDGTGGIE
jgi:hypothetical protein